MKKILLTGSSGFVGGNALSFLKKNYEVFAPKRNELDVRDYEQVKKCLEIQNFDVVVHFASPSPARTSNNDTFETLFEDSLRIFMNFYSLRDRFGKMIYSGSGAEYDKRRDISMVKESEIGYFLPNDAYGLSKYVINELARTSDNIFNLRIFACFGPGEDINKFISYAIQSCLNSQAITIQQDCFFDYLYIDDYIKYLIYFIEHTPKYHDYNATSGKRIKLSDIAEIVRDLMGNPKPIQILTPGLNREYTSDNSRILSETGITKLLSITEGIERLIEWKSGDE